MVSAPAPQRMAPWYWHLWPHFLSFSYVCEDKELHYVTIGLWLKMKLYQRDKAIVHLPKVIGMLYGFDAAMAAAQPAGEETTH
jgi:hypothetical protein